MRIERASIKAVRYAIMTWHYSQAVPSVVLSYSVFNDADEWCGVVCYSAGSNNNIGSQFNLPQGAIVELVRVALNGKQASTSQAVAATLRAVKKDAPLVKLIVSYADPEQGHVGTIYQAMNWVYSGTSKAQREVIDPATGKIMHKRSANSKYGTIKGLEKSHLMFKHKYLFPLSKDMKKFCETLRKPYPKKAVTLESPVTTP